MKKFIFTGVSIIMGILTLSFIRSRSEKVEEVNKHCSLIRR